MSPPRLDSVDAQQKVEALNACLVAATSDAGVTFINNDLNFKLADGTPNDGYIQADGVHLTSKGVNRLARNIQLKMKPGVTNIVKSSASTRQLPSANENNGSEWKTVERKHKKQRGQSTLYSSHLKYYSSPSQDRYASCWFCGETNHVSKNCRHGKKIECHQCGSLGHKAKVCTY